MWYWYKGGPVSQWNRTEYRNRPTCVRSIEFPQRCLCNSVGKGTFFLKKRDARTIGYLYAKKEKEEKEI